MKAAQDIGTITRLHETSCNFANARAPPTTPSHAFLSSQGMSDFAALAGFFYITNHGIDQSIIDANFAAAERCVHEQQNLNLWCRAVLGSAAQPVRQSVLFVLFIQSQLMLHLHVKLAPD